MFLFMASGGCVGFWAKGAGSVSTGHHTQGALVRSVALPLEGTGFEIPPGWRIREARYTTEEVLGWLMGAFRAVAGRYPGAVAQVGDLSRRGGGRLVRHRSHESGRDIDIFFYAVDSHGRPFRSPRGVFRFGADGWAVAWSFPDARTPVREPVPLVRLDARRTWALVSAMLQDPSAEVQWIFIHKDIARMLLDEAASSGEEPGLVARAAALFHQPRGVDPHDDHMHVRVFCDPNDRIAGCRDSGPTRWWKKRWKYIGRGTSARADEPMVAPDRPAVAFE
jgi:penicillin-insensitive murein DD-endopeptidase